MFTLLGHLLTSVQNNVIAISLKYVPIYRKYTGSESDIQNKSLLYRMHQQHQNTFETKQFCLNISKKRTYPTNTLFYMYELHNLYFIDLGYFCIFCISSIYYFFIVIFLSRNNATSDANRAQVRATVRWPSFAAWTYS